MNRYSYHVIESFCEHFGVPVYGIAVYSKDSPSGEPLCSIKDISPDRAAVTRLAEQCQRLHLDPIHLLDVVEDFLL